MSSLIKRTRQFLRAVSTKITPSDLVVVKQYLNQSEQILFFNMDPAIQKHCVNTALTILNMPVERTGPNRPVLIKAALLHDIGKIRGSINLWDRVCYVLVKKCSGKLVYKLASPSTGTGNVNSHRHGSPLARFRNALYVHLHHPELGAELAAKAGLDENIVYLLRHHHDIAKATSSKELAALMKADELN